MITHLMSSVIMACPGAAAFFVALDVFLIFVAVSIPVKLFLHFLNR